MRVMFHRLNNRAPNLLHIFLYALSISSQIIANSLLILLAACISYSFINSSNIFAKRYHFWTLDFLLLSRREFGKMTATLSDEIDAVFNLKNVKKITTLSWPTIDGRNKGDAMAMIQITGVCAKL